MVNKVLLAFATADLFFALTGGAMLGFTLVIQRTCFDPPTNGTDAARDLLYREFPFTVAIVNSALIFAVFLMGVPALLMPGSGFKGWLKACGFGAVVCALFTMGIGVDLWVLTLRMNKELEGLWVAQSSEVQSLMQTTFQCCGYTNSTTPVAFVTDSTCASPASAALVQGCATPLVSFGNTVVDNVFTALFGMAALDAVLVVAVACLLKDRKERARFRHIDEKSGFGRF